MYLLVEVVVELVVLVFILVVFAFAADVAVGAARTPAAAAVVHIKGSRHVFSPLTSLGRCVCVCEN